MLRRPIETTGIIGKWESAPRGSRSHSENPTYKGSGSLLCPQLNGNSIQNTAPNQSERCTMPAIFGAETENLSKVTNGGGEL